MSADVAGAWPTELRVDYEREPGNVDTVRGRSGGYVRCDVPPGTWTFTSRPAAGPQ